MSPDDLPYIEERIRSRSPVQADIDPLMRAAVAVVLAADGADLSVLLIERAQHPLDPWSGHMAFPGGRHEATDASLERTAIRETLEEVGIDLARHGRYVARLDEVQAQARGRELSMVITPFLFVLDRVRPTTLDTREVADAIWVPLKVCHDDGHRGSTHISRDGYDAHFPAILYRGKTVWGLTYRILCAFLEALGEDGPDSSASSPSAG